MECAPYLIGKRRSLEVPITRYLSKNLPEMNKMIQLIQLPHYNVYSIKLTTNKSYNENSSNNPNNCIK